MYHGVPQKLFSLVIIRNVFDQQISILERFLKDYVMLEWSNYAETISFASTGLLCILKP